MDWIFFFFNDTATTEIYTLSLHDALPILRGARRYSAAQTSQGRPCHRPAGRMFDCPAASSIQRHGRSEEHTSELQSRQYLVCRLLLEKKKITKESVLVLTTLETTSQ